MKKLGSVILSSATVGVAFAIYVYEGNVLIFLGVGGIGYLGLLSAYLFSSPLYLFFVTSIFLTSMIFSLGFDIASTLAGIFIGTLTFLYQYFFLLRRDSSG